MKRLSWICTVIAVLALGAICPQILADDVNPPYWRGDAATTFQHWHFPEGNAGGPAPDDYDNSAGTPSMSVFGLETDGANWSASHAGADGVWEIIDTFDGYLEFAVPNAVDGGICSVSRGADPAGQDQKTPILQITYLEGTSGPPVIEMTAQGGTPFTEDGDPVEITLPNGYTHLTTNWIGPATAMETVKIYPAGGQGGGGTTYIDQIVIDTHCGPIVPAVSEWGIAVMVALIVTAGTIVVSRTSRQRRVPRAAGFPPDSSGPGREA